MHLRNKVAGIILAGGSGTRFGGDVNKVYQPLCGIPIINYSIKAFDIHKEVDEIIVVIREGDEEFLKDIHCSKPIKIIHGGSSRSQSVFNGLMATKADIVLIQDGARPFLRQYYITDLLEALENYPGATMGIRSKDTVKIAFENQLVARTTKRTNTWLVQTPQCFRRGDIVNAHLNYIGSEPTDDCMMLERQKKDVIIVSGDDTNIKITTRSDMYFAEHILKEKIFVE